jgi:hypothetical protein
MLQQTDGDIAGITDILQGLGLIKNGVHPDLFFSAVIQFPGGGQKRLQR